MRLPHPVAAFSLALLTSLAAQAEDDFPGVEALMGAEQFKRTGLNKLSDSELEALDEWLLRYTAGEAEEVKAASEEVKKVEKTLEVTASVKQPFTGWKGETVFYLDNGQVWQQRVQGRYQYAGEDTRVVIRKGLFGFYNMKLIAVDKSIGVKRIR